FLWTQWMSEFKVTITAAPNFAYDILGRYAGLLADVDLSSLRCAISGGEPIDPDGFDRFVAAMARFGFDPAVAAPSYGMAESTCAVTMPYRDEGARYDEVTLTPPGAGATPIRRRYALLGEPLEGMEIRVVAPSVEAPVIDGREVGQVEIRGTSMMSGYLGREPVAAGEWFDTGDLGYLVDGNLVICGRAKEVVIVAGRNLFPVEIERAVGSIAGVRRGGVVAMARGEGSARPGLVIVAEYRGAEPDEARRQISSVVAAECAIVPAQIIFVAPHSVPRTTSGKVRRLATRELLDNNQLERVG
ncbi:MAG: AMP-binding protein, partial [Gordonia sp. (in: high G+C Gram-positive bacteria)]